MRSSSRLPRSSGSNLRSSCSKIRSSGSNLRSSCSKIRSSGSNLRSSCSKIRSSGSNLGSSCSKIRSCRDAFQSPKWAFSPPRTASDVRAAGRSGAWPKVRRAEGPKNNGGRAGARPAHRARRRWNASRTRRAGTARRRPEHGSRGEHEGDRTRRTRSSTRSSRSEQTGENRSEGPEHPIPSSPALPPHHGAAKDDGDLARAPSSPSLRGGGRGRVFASGLRGRVFTAGGGSLQPFGPLRSSAPGGVPRSAANPRPKTAQPDPRSLNGRASGCSPLGSRFESRSGSSRRRRGIAAAFWFTVWAFWRPRAVGGWTRGKSRQDGGFRRRGGNPPHPPRSRS